MPRVACSLYPAVAGAEALRHGVAFPQRTASRRTSPHAVAPQLVAADAG